MQVKIDEANGISLCRVSGDIDINSSPDVKKTFDQVISQKKDKVVINLKEVGYIDSSGLATLVEVLKNLRSYGGKLKLSNLSSKVKGLFEITKLDKLFDIVDEEDDAVTTF